MPPVALWQLQYPWDSGLSLCFVVCVCAHSIVCAHVGTCVGWTSLGQCVHGCTYLCECMYLCVSTCVCVTLIATHMNMQISFRERMCSALKPTLRCWPNFTHCSVCVCVDVCGCTCLSMHFAKLGRTVRLKPRCVSRCVCVCVCVTWPVSVYSVYEAEKHMR